jgi:hypothetical protein
LADFSPGRGFVSVGESGALGGRFSRLR